MNMPTTQTDSRTFDLHKIHTHLFQMTLMIFTLRYQENQCTTFIVYI